MDPLVRDSRHLGDELLTFVRSTVESLAAAHFPEWRIPSTFAGHFVDADVRADLLYTLTHLAAGGVSTIGGTPIDDVVATLLTEVDGPRTHTFFSYRVAETLLRRGPFADNPLLTCCSSAQRDSVAHATDSRDWLELLDAAILPRNYAAVLSRCELARTELGLSEDPAVLDRLVVRLRDLLTQNPLHTLDDSNDGSGRYDIYTADIWLFCEPLAPRLGEVWATGRARRFTSSTPSPVPTVPRFRGDAPLACFRRHSPSNSPRSHCTTTCAISGRVLGSAAGSMRCARPAHASTPTG